MLKAMLTEPAQVWELAPLLESCGWDDQAHVAGAGGSLAEYGLVSKNEKSSGILADCAA